jgi:hypothetical protein
MDELPNARSAAASERTSDVADMRKCIGSATFGIEAHEAPPDEFPAQPSQKDGLGRMCKPHWNQYTSALRKAALARKAVEGVAPAEALSTEPEPVAVAAPKAPGGRKTKESRTPKPEPIRTKPARAPKRDGALMPAAGSQGDAG